ncbi:hypothetical protein LS73_000170 [Helicobacter muridarum]|uniref:Uncharacterized protein n=1 Tax=Helicobacter muridarum TaxID=216 RepID=A0A099TV03_9HELI|nr:hypothetical protein [Helicobacter muridarum]TLE01598.1 hypothetical protein LS73_000170 [Helicobacter muridarum]STQ86212.1 Uncharacterised protein [Helicobacter muridarum]
MPLPIELDDSEEILIAYCFNLALDFKIGAASVIECVDYAVIRDYCKKHRLDSIEVLSICKEMIALRMY